ncbi:hypothetical protein KNE206_57480 [Kitasatospora sp. NE20-6]
MPFDSLRSFLDSLEEAGQLLRVNRQVSPEPDLGAAGRAVADLGDKAPALLFTAVHGYRDAQVALNVHGSWPNHALMLDLPPDTGPREQFFELHRRWKNFPVAAERRDATPPWQEVSITENINLFDLFPLFRLNTADGGPYIDKAAVVSRDPEAPDDFGRQNVGIYRLQVKGPAKLAVQAAPIHDLGGHMAAASRRGARTLPVAICLGNDPVLSLVAAMPLKSHQSEYEMAGALQEAPYPVATSPVHGLDVPWVRRRSSRPRSCSTNASTRDRSASSPDTAAADARCPLFASTPCTPGRSRSSSTSTWGCHGRRSTI